MKQNLLASFILFIFSLSPLLQNHALGDSVFYVVIASDPQLDWACVTPECLAVAKSVRDQAILSNHWQADSINQVAAHYGSEFRGVLVNGDLTAFGHQDELALYLEHFKNRIKAPVYPGLGNHDYANNINDCLNNNCAARMVYYLHDQVQGMGDQIKSYDLSESSVFYNFPSYRKSYTGSLSYSFDIDGVHFVQLNNYSGYKTSFNTWNYRSARRDHFVIEPSLNWLKGDLEKAREECKTVIVNLHDFHEHMEPGDRHLFVNIMASYNTSAVFSGHFHEATGFSDSSSPIPGFLSGSSSYNRYLLVKFINNRLVNVFVIKSVYGNVVTEATYEFY